MAKSKPNDDPVVAEIKANEAAHAERERIRRETPGTGVADGDHERFKGSTHPSDVTRDLRSEFKPSGNAR